MSEASFEAAAPSEEYIEPTTAVAAPTRKQGMNIYTVMLVISFVCLVIGTIILFVEFSKFGTWNTSTAQPKTSMAPVQQFDAGDRFYAQADLS